MTNLRNNFFSLFSLQDKKQSLRIRRGLYAMFGAGVHTTVCYLLWLEGYFRTTGSQFIALFSLFWVGHLSYIVILQSGINKRFKDPSLTFPMIIWAISCVMVTCFLTQDLRVILLMFYFLILVFGAFSMNWRSFVAINFYGISLYLFIIFYLYYTSPQQINLNKETLIFIGYIAVAAVLSFICAEMNSLRGHLHDKNEKLSEALKYIESISVTDELTQIKNRRYILTILENQKNLVERDRYGFAVCMIDIDLFKSVNDAHGHKIGDDILKELCEKITKNIRRIDYFARFGGEEFLLVFPLTSLEHAKLSAERLRGVIENSNFDHIIPGLKMTISIGVTAYHWPEATDVTLARADAALYLAKQSGRNQVVVN